MKIIKIFVSISFEQGVNEIADFISMLNDVYIQKDIYFEIRFNSDSGEKGSKNLQEKQSIEREIGECSFFYIIIGETFCNDMEIEFDLALSRFRDENLPLIYTYFSRLNKNPLPGRVHAFMRRLECELEHYYTLFETIHAVKLNMVLEIIRNTEGGKQVKVSNGNIYIEDRQILSVKEIPVFKNNQELQALNQEYIELTEAFFDAKIRYSENTEDYGLFESLYKLGEKRKTVFEQISDLEQNIFDLCVLTSELKSRSHIGMRRRKACECIDAGNYKAALDLLRDPIREKELFIAKTGQNAAVNRIKEYIEEEKLAISALQGQKISADSIEETAAHYRKCVELIETYHVKFHLLYEYAGFLYDNGFYESAVHIGKKYQKYLGFFKASKSDAARNYYHIAQSYGMLGKKRKAEKYLIKALEIRKEIVEGNANNSSEDIFELASLYDVLGMMILYDKDRLEEAFQYEIMAVIILRQAADEYVRDLADYCGNAGVIMRRLQNWEVSETFHKFSLELKEKLILMKPESLHLKKALAISYNDFGVLYMDKGEIDKARELYQKSLSLSLELEKIDSRRHLERIAKSYDNLFKAELSLGNIQEAEVFINEELKIREKLAFANFEIHGISLAEAYGNKGILCAEKNSFDDSRVCLEKTLEILKQCNLYKEDKEILARACHNIAILYFRMKNYVKARECLYTEIEIYEQLAKDGGTAYGNLLKKKYSLLIDALMDMGYEEDAKEFKEKSGRIQE